ncbi:hypothetical protein RND81_10G165900 [Saponaria officinalis]|uniref:PGG domain-containing protein n=1 Tax=Saponaria officinalis TaxID=3572 RepID=A0AAW1I2U2_SAPOF
MNTSEFRVKKLYDAALEGDVPSLLNLLKDDPLVLDRCNIENSSLFVQSPLHIAVNIGHLGFTNEILSRKPELAEEVDQIKRWSALHIASGKGHLEIVKALLFVSPNMCLSTDVDGLNPVHVAAVKGQVHVLDELLRAVPQAIRGRTNAGSTVLHLCVQHCQAGALEYLINVMDDAELLNLKDGDGNTVLHLAVANKQPEMVKFLVKNQTMEKNAINKNGLTAMDIQIRSKKGTDDKEIWVPLKRAKAVKAKTVLKALDTHHSWIENQQNALMVVATLIAGMAFQVGINPPGGAWQDDNGHIAGHSIMADVEKEKYNALLISNTIGLVSSLSVILLLISGLPCKRLFVMTLMVTIGISVSATTYTYLVSVSYLTGYTQSLSESKNHHIVWLAVKYSLYVWLLLMGILLLAHVVLITIKIIRELIHLGVILYKCCLSFAARRLSL